MSRVGKLPINVPGVVQVKLDRVGVSIVGPKGEIFKTFTNNISISLANNKIVVLPLAKTKHSIAMWGTARSIISNMVQGVTEGFKKELTISGVGYRAALKDQYLNLMLAKSHNTKIEIPRDIKVSTPKPNVIVLECIDKEKLGQFVSIIVKQRPPEPYKGKGIDSGKYIQRKEGKKN